MLPTVQTHFTIFTLRKNRIDTRVKCLFFQFSGSKREPFTGGNKKKTPYRAFNTKYCCNSVRNAKDSRATSPAIFVRNNSAWRRKQRLIEKLFLSWKHEIPYKVPDSK